MSSAVPRLIYCCVRMCDVHLSLLMAVESSDLRLNILSSTIACLTKLIYYIISFSHAGLVTVAIIS